jgi:hypothetical protein
VVDPTNAERIRFSLGELWFLFFRTILPGVFFFVWEEVVAGFLVAGDRADCWVEAGAVVD